MVYVYKPVAEPISYRVFIIQDVPLATEPGISLIILPLMRILQRNFEAELPHCVRNLKE